MSLKEILELDRDRVRREKVVYHTIYDRLKNKINNSAKVGAKFCIYVIPEFIPGYPLPNIDKTMSYLYRKLYKEGFISIPITKYELFVTWDPVKIRNIDKNEKSSKINLYAKIDERDNDILINSMVQSKLFEKS
jgi:hypothetical protein